MPWHGPRSGSGHDLLPLAAPLLRHQRRRTAWTRVSPGTWCVGFRASRAGTPTGDRRAMAGSATPGDHPPSPHSGRPVGPPGGWRTPAVTVDQSPGPARPAPRTVVRRRSSAEQRQCRILVRTAPRALGRTSARSDRDPVRCRGVPGAAPGSPRRRRPGRTACPRAWVRLTRTRTRAGPQPATDSSARRHPTTTPRPGPTRPVGRRALLKDQDRCTLRPCDRRSCCCPSSSR